MTFKLATFVSRYKFLGKQIWYFHFNNLANQKTVVDMNKDKEFGAKELPDGMTIDINGNLWVANFFGDRIVNIDSKTGRFTFSKKDY